MLSGQTASSLSLTSVSSADAGTYTVVVSGTCGNAVTNSASLAVNTAVSASPMSNLIRNVGECATFSTVATGTGPFAYRWLKDGTALAETNSSLVIASVTTNHAGTYAAVVSGACGSVTNFATLTVKAKAPINTTPLADLTRCPGIGAVHQLRYHQGTRRQHRGDCQPGRWGHLPHPAAGHL